MNGSMKSLVESLFDDDLVSKSPLNKIGDFFIQADLYYEVQNSQYIEEIFDFKKMMRDTHTKTEKDALSKIILDIYVVEDADVTRNWLILKIREALNKYWKVGANDRICNVTLWKPSGGMNIQRDVSLDEIHILDISVGGYMKRTGDSASFFIQFKHK